MREIVTEQQKQMAEILLANGWERQGMDSEGVPITYLQRPCETAREEAEECGEEWDPDEDPCMIWLGDLEDSSLCCRSCRSQAARALGRSVLGAPDFRPVQKEQI